MPTLDQWHQMWLALGARTTDDALCQSIVVRYAEPHRKYHTIRHLDDCLARLPAVRSEATHPAEIEVALWFHDAVYDARAKDNEQRSADWAQTACLDAGLAREVADRVHALVLATRHTAPSQGRDATVIADIDLSILGDPPERFDEYERQIRQEYLWVPAQFFRRERRKIVEEFLSRPRIFGTDFYFNGFETQARQNLRRSVKRLGG